MIFTMSEVQAMIALVASKADSFGPQNDELLMDLILKCKSHCSYRRGESSTDLVVHVPEFTVGD